MKIYFYLHSFALLVIVNFLCNYFSETPCTAVSDVKGNVTLLKVNATSVDLLLTLKAHDYEAWICAFDYWNPEVIYSGK